MDFGEPDAVQVRLDGINVRQLVDQELLELLESKFKKIKAINLTLIVDDDIKDMITISHPFVDLEEGNKIIIDVNEPETLKKTIEVLRSYKE